MWPASDKQIKYVLGLYDERQLPEAHGQITEVGLRLMERDEVSAEINLLKTYPRKEGHAGGDWSGIPAGRFALEVDGVWRFYDVDKPKEGRWKGYTFIKRLRGAPGSYVKDPMAASARNEALALIAKDPKRAMLDYGLQSGVCGRCSSPLTDPDSLARGIGPKCATKSGWF